MATTPANVDGDYGIETTESGITIESRKITGNPQVEKVPDQKNAVADEITYDTRVDLELTYRGTKLTASDGVVTFDGVKYAVDSHEDAGTYNGLQRYTLRAHKYDNYPAQS